MSEGLTPREIVAELDRYIVGQSEAKKAVAVALRNRWRRLQLSDAMQEEIVPKNILMIGPTGVGKTEIARRIAKIVQAPFVKVEATKFTEVGYVGRDVEQIIRDLTEISLQLTKNRLQQEYVGKARAFAIERILDTLVGESASSETRKKFQTMLLAGELDTREIDIQVQDNVQMPTFDVPGMPGAQMGMLNLGDMFGKALGVGKTRTRRVTVKNGLEILTQEEAEKCLDQDTVVKEAIRQVESRGIVFVDEIDKISARSDRHGSDVSREGVQRDLLPLIEGTTVNTKHGPVKTDHILFITSGAFHLAKPSDLLPELQGRLPIRVELSPLAEDDFVKILTQTEANLIRQSEALLLTESVALVFEEGAIRKIAYLAAYMNSTVENIGARRLHTIFEKLLEDVSFDADHLDNKNVTITEAYVSERIAPLTQNQDLSRFIL